MIDFSQTNAPLFTLVGLFSETTDSYRKYKIVCDDNGKNCYGVLITR